MAGPIKQLHVEGFDEEMIWEELRLQNLPLLKHLEAKVAKLLNARGISLLKKGFTDVSDVVNPIGLVPPFVLKPVPVSNGNVAATPNRKEQSAIACGGSEDIRARWT